MSSGSYRTDGSVLIGNWYEQRFRTEESPYITVKETQRPGYGGGPIPLKIAPVENMYLTANAESQLHAMPATRQALRMTEKLIEQKRQSALVSLDAKKELVAQHSKHFPKYHGYGAVIPRHPPGRDHRILATTTHTDYGGAYSGDISKRTEHFSVAAHARDRAASAGGVGFGGLSASASATALAPLSASTRGAAPGTTAAGAGASAAAASGSSGGATVRPSSVGGGTLRPVALLRSPLIASGINVDVDPTRPLCKPPPASLSATAHTAVVSAVTGNAPTNPAALGAAGARAPKPKRSQGAATFGATGERLRIAPSADPKEHTFVQRAWLYDRSVNNHFLGARTDKYAGLAAVPGAGLNIGSGHGFGVPQEGRTSFARRSAGWKDPTGVWSG